MEIFRRKDFLEVGAFARVFTCDPNMKSGPATDRLKPTPKEVLVMDEYLFPNTDENYKVPTGATDKCSIGLRWLEPRSVRKMSIEFSEDSILPDVRAAKVQWWVGESAWQGWWGYDPTSPLKVLMGSSFSNEPGGWKELTGHITTKGRIWSFEVSTEDINASRREFKDRGVEKIRWVFDKVDAPVFVRRPKAFTASLTDIAEVEFRLEAPISNQFARITMYNGTLLQETDDREVYSRDWELDKPLTSKVRYAKDIEYLADKTSIRIQFEDRMVTIAVADILEKGPVYFAQCGLVALKKGSKFSHEEYKARMAENKPILDRVRNMPDQSFEQAWENVHRKKWDNSPMMLSLACDNVKYIVHPDGRIVVPNSDYRRQYTDHSFYILPAYGSGQNLTHFRNLYEDWMPIPVQGYKENNVVYSQRSFVAPTDRMRPNKLDWLKAEPLFVSEFTIENTAAKNTKAKLLLEIMAKTDTPADLQFVDKGVVVLVNDKVTGYIETSSICHLQVMLGKKGLVVQGQLPAGSKEQLNVYLPGWAATLEQVRALPSSGSLLTDTQDYWKNILSVSTAIEIPSNFLKNIILASQVHCFIAARNKNDGSGIVPWISADIYGPLESESQPIIIGMDMMGQEEFARGCHQFYLDKYVPEGYMTTGYTLMGTAQHLIALGEHYQLNRNKQWMKNVRPTMIKASEWIIEQIDNNKNLYSNGEKPYDYGLFPPSLYADWSRFAYHTYLNAFYYGGLKEAVAALYEADDPRASMMLEKAEQYRNDFIRAYKWTQERCPLLRQSDGNWKYSHPAMIGCLGLVGDVYKGEDADRAWAKDGGKVPLMFATSLMSPDTERQEAIDEAGNQEDVVFLKAGLGAYSVEEIQNNWFNLGGFDKCQPYYSRLCETYALLDERKPFIRAYFNPIGSLVDSEVLSFWEHCNGLGGWNKTHETGRFLEQTRLMLLTERGNDLWLAPFVTSHWMQDGMMVSVRQAPTRFGTVAYTITSHINDGYIEAKITPPIRNAPDSIVVRLRHPHEKKIQSVTVDGKEYNNFDSEKETVTITSWSGTISVRAVY